MLWQLVPFIGKAQLKIAKVDQVIPDAEKKQVLKARKLFNEFKVYDGERILKDLIKTHPTIPYYHEALVQLQRQVLYQLRPAQEEYEAYTNAQNPISESDTSDEEAPELYAHQRNDKNQPIAKKPLVEKEWNGLETGPRKEDKIKRKKVKDEEVDESVLKEAIVTIDSSLLRDDVAEDENGVPIPKKVKRDKTFERQLKAISELAQIPYDGYKNELIRNARKATLMIEYADSASAYLYQFLVDTLDPDMRVGDAAKEAYQKGIDEWLSDDPVAAKRLFEKAISLHADYFSAHIALGDAWHFLGKDTNVIKQFHKANLLQPNKTQPLEKLCDFYYQRGKYKEAAVAIIDAMHIYPMQHYMQLLKKIVNKTGKDFNTQWLQREVYPLTTSKNYFEITGLEKTSWWIYQAAESDVHSYFDTLGIVRPNEKTNERYLEIYAWKKMLADTKKELFPFARAMNKIGLLECYVFISCFHHDLYSQFADYVKQHPQKVNDYMYILINWEDKKFDKLRKEFFEKKEERKEEKK